MYCPKISDIDRVTNGKTEFYKCTNRMYRGQKLQVHYNTLARKVKSKIFCDHTSDIHHFNRGELYILNMGLKKSVHGAPEEIFDKTCTYPHTRNKTLICSDLTTL